jgi:ATP-binding cassette subfamily B protein
MLTSILTLIGTVIMMFVVSPVLACVALVTVPTSLFMMRFVAKRIHALHRASGRRPASSTRLVEESFTGHAIVKAFGRQRDVEGASVVSTTPCTSRASERSSSPVPSSR